MPTINALRIAPEPKLTVEFPFRVPDALRHPASRGLLARFLVDNWETIRDAGTSDSFEDLREELLSELGVSGEDFYKVNMDTVIPKDVWEVDIVHAGMAGSVTPADIPDVVGDVIAAVWADGVAQEVRERVLRVTGKDTDSWPNELDDYVLEVG